jgi:glycosyltransferase involved in cell wall biosynthesis
VQISVVIPTRELARVPEVPPGADELLLMGGNDGIAHAKNLGARYAHGDVLVFLDDDLRLEGDLNWFRGRSSSECWWTCTYADATGDPYTASMVSRLNVGSRIGMNAASIGAFLGIRRSTFWAAGGFPEHALHEDTTLSRTLGRLGFRLHLAPLTGTVQRRFSTLQETWRRNGPHLRSPKAREAPYRRLVPPTTLRTG